MKKVIKGIKLFSVIFLALAYVGCDDDDVVLPQVQAGFTQTINQNAGVVSFLNTSVNANTYEWDFGDGTTSTEINPTKVYASSGTYTVVLTSKNVSGSSDTFQDEIAINIPDVVALPLTFDGENVDYSTITTFDTAFEIIPNPDTTGTNTSASNVGQISPNGQPFQGVTFNFEIPLDFSGPNKTIELQFWSDTPTDILVKLSQGISGARDSEVLVSHGGTGWEILTFNFATSAVRSFIEGDPTNGQPIVPDGQYAAIDLFVGFNQALTNTVYVDDIVLIQSEVDTGSIEVCEGGELVNDFESSDNSIFNNFGGGEGTVIDNPDATINMSAKLAQYVKNAGEPFGGITIALDNAINFNAGSFSIDVKSSSVRQLLFKLEGVNIELIQPTSGEGWETLTYDFSEVANNIGDVTGITLIMDNGTQGDGTAEWTIQFDNIRLCSNVVLEDTGSITACDGGELINDFESADDSIFNNFGGGVGTVIGNPITNINMSATLGQYIKNADQPFGGITIALQNNIALNAGVFSIDVKSSVSRQLLFKLEGLNIELIQPTSGAGWETLTYDFSTVAGNMGDVTGITLIMDNGTVGEGGDDWTIQFDNIRLCTNGDTGGGTGNESAYCDTLIRHFPFTTETISDALLTIESVERADGFPALKFTVKTEPSNNKVPDLIIVQNLSESDGGGGNGLEAMDTSVPGEVSVEAFWPSGAPPNNETTFQVLWSFEGEDGNWQLFENPTETIVLDVVCDDVGGGGGTANTLEGSWIINNTPGSAGVGPAVGDVSFFDLTTQAAERACFFDDVYTFGTDGSFSIAYGAETFLEGWQSGVANACGAPVAPHDNSIPATFTYDETTDTLVLNGMGAFIGLPKVTNAGELPAVPEPAARTYTVTFDDADNITVSINDSANNVVWTYKMSRS